MPFPDWFHELARSVNNWGRWGADDQIGTINLIDGDATRRGAASVRTGRSLSLALPLSEAEGIQLGFMPGRLNPTRTMSVINMAITGDPSVFCTSDDLVVMGLQAATHWDGLGHVSYDGRLYNGFPASAITAAGAGACGIHNIRSIVTRGVLLDVARAKGVDRLDAGYAITGDDLDEASDFAKISVQPGDVVLIRTGQMQHLRPGPAGGAPDKMAYSMGAAGPSTKSVRWFRDRDVAAVATDNLAFEVFPCEFDDAFLPVHPLHLVEMGLTQGQNWQLEELSADCADDGVYGFLLEASPQPFTNAVGSPVNPIATK